jgi:hypothetical protein
VLELKLGNFEATFLKTGEILYKAEDGNTYTADKNVLGQRIYQKVDAQTGSSSITSFG